MGRVKQGAGAGVDERLAKALTHPLRLRILTMLHDGVASPNELAKELGEPLGNVSYHARTLERLGCIELVRTAQRRGAIEHYYRAIKRPFFNDRDWKRLPPSARQSVSDLALQLIWTDTSDALKAGVFDSRDDRHLSRTPLVLDKEAWEELNELLAGVVARAAELTAESAVRLSRSDGDGIRSRLVLMHFEAAAEDSGPRGARRARGRRRAKSGS